MSTEFIIISHKNAKWLEGMRNNVKLSRTCGKMGAPNSSKLVPRIYRKPGMMIFDTNILFLFYPHTFFVKMGQYNNM